MEPDCGGRADDRKRGTFIAEYNTKSLQLSHAEGSMASERKRIRNAKHISTLLSMLC
jgi:predicted RecB family endonuclease